MSSECNPPPYAGPSSVQMGGVSSPSVVVGTPTVVVGEPGVVGRPGVVGGPAVVVGSPIVYPVTVGQQMGSQPCRHTCQSCGAQIVTRVLQKSTMKTHLAALLLCLLGCWCCVCVPYCVDSCQNADHYCPSCNAYIGSYVN